MKHSIKNSVFLFALLFFVSAGSLYSQNEDIRADYDSKKEILTIENIDNGLYLIQMKGCIDATTKTDAKKAEEAVKEAFKGSDGYRFDDKKNKIVFYISKEKMVKGSKVHYLAQDKCCEPFSVEVNIPDETVKAVETQGKTSGSAGITLKEWVLYISIFVVIVFFIVITFFKFKKRKPQSLENKQADPGVLVRPDDDDNDEATDYVVGLNGVRNDIKNYFTLDARDVYSDTAIHKIYISRLAIKSMYDLFKKFLEDSEQTPETGCYIVGRWEYATPDNSAYNISLENLVEPGDDVVYGEYALNFGLKIGVILGSTIVNLREKTNCNYVHTAWMHSHPGLGLFLSSQDLVVQNGLAYSDAKKRMLAVVIDTNTPDWQMAIFTPKTIGGMNNREDAKMLPYSLDVLYQWSRKANEENSGAVTINTENYFELSVKNDMVRSVLFDAKAINDLDDILYAQNKGLTGFFFGVSQVADSKMQNIVIEKCMTVHSSQICGCLVADAVSTYAEILAKYESVINKYSFFIVYRSDNELFMSVKNHDELYPKEENALIKFSLDQMKEWTRRRRKIL